MSSGEFKKKYETPSVNSRCLLCAVRKNGKCDGIKLPLIYSLLDLEDQYKKHADCDDLRMSIDENGYMTINISYPYIIAPDNHSLYSKDGASWWVNHLMKKPWFDWHDALVFLTKVYKHADIPGKEIRVELV